MYKHCFFYLSYKFMYIHERKLSLFNLKCLQIRCFWNVNAIYRCLTMYESSNQHTVYCKYFNFSKVHSYKCSFVSSTRHILHVGYSLWYEDVKEIMKKTIRYCLFYRRSWFWILKCKRISKHPEQIYLHWTFLCFFVEIF